MPYVLVHPLTLKPTAFEPNQGTTIITSGPYQNVAWVTEEWRQEELKRIMALKAERDTKANGI